MSSQTPSLPQPGELVGGRFRILEHLGTGGFGTVYKAVQENFGRDVAIKFLTPGVAEDPINVERFRREAFHVSKLRHPNTVTMYDYGQTEDGLVYMVMELLNGQALGEHIQSGGALAAPRAAHVFIHVLKSLSEAHRNGLVHRDLKPENIFLCELFGENDYVKVLDFGVAKMTRMDADDDDDGEEALTKAGRIFGTPMYMAPEQACAEEITPATDVYALGLLLYEIWTGKPPVTGSNRMEVIHKQIRDPVPELDAGFESTAVGQVIRRACKKNQDRRYQNAAEFLEALVDALRTMHISPAPEGGGISPELSLERLADTDGPDEATRQIEVPAQVAAGSERRQNADANATTTAPVGPPPLPEPAPADVDQDNVDTQPSPVVAPAAPPAQRAQRSHPSDQVALIGRQDILGRLQTVVEEAVAESSGRIVVIEGESGIGKSRVVRRLRRQLGADDVEVCTGHCRRRSLPMEALREALAGAWGVAHSERAEIDRVIRADMGGAEGIDDRDIDFIVDFIRPRPTDASQMPRSEEAAGALFARLERLALKLAQRRPFVLIVEDIQHADSATMSFLEYLAVTLRTQAAPIVVMMTLRPEQRGLHGDLDQSLSTINANVGVGFERMRLKRLSGAKLGELLDEILPLQSAIKERIGWLSQGVPLHALQIIQYLRNEQKLVRQGDRWGLKSGSPRDINLPPDLMDLMRLRLRQAVDAYDGDGDLRALLEWMAVLGIRTPVDLLVGVLAATGDVDVDRLDEALAALTDQGLVHQTMGRNLTCVEFDSSLLREALLDDLSDSWSNRRVHQQAARHKIDFYADRGLEAPLVEIADHWRLAGQMGRYRQTLFEAASRSKERFDLGGARRRFRELLRSLDPRGASEDMWVQTHLALAELARRFGEFGRAEDHYRRVIAAGVDDKPVGAEALRGFAHLLFVQRRNHDALGHYEHALALSNAADDTAGVAKALVGLSRVYLMRGDADTEAQNVRQRLEDMLPRLPAGDIAGRVRLHLAEVAQRQGRLDMRHDYLVGARQELADSGDRQGLSDVLIALGSSLMEPASHVPDRLERARDVLREALDIKRSVGDRHGVAEAFRHLGQLALEHGEFANGRKLLTRSLDVHQVLGAPFNIGAVHNSLGLAFLSEGKIEAAEHHFQESIDIFERLGDPIARSHAMLNKGVAAINGRDLPRAQSLLRDARRIKESAGSSWALFDLRNYLAVVAMWLGEFGEAEQILDTTLDDVDERGTDEDRCVARTLMGLLRCFQSRLQLAALELGRARADAEELGTTRVTNLCHANAALYARLTESQPVFEKLIDSLESARLFHSLSPNTWLALVEHMAEHSLDQDYSRQSVRLLRTVADLHTCLGDPERADQLSRRAADLDAGL